MGKSVEMISMFATAPTAGAAATVCTGNSLTIRQSNAPTRLLAASGLQQATVGFGRYTSPQLHDTTNGILLNYAASAGTCQFFDAPQPLYSQDTITSTISGSAVAGDIECRQIWVGYDDLPGVDGKFIDWVQLNAMGEELYSVPITAAAVATGQYSTQVAINSSQDQYKANRDYAILGANFSGTLTATAAIRIIGPDLGNIGTGIPVTTFDKSDSSSWFTNMSMHTQWPCIPVINSSNKALTFIAQQGNENAASLNVSLLMCLLKPVGSQPATRARGRRMGRGSRRK